MTRSKIAYVYCEECDFHMEYKLPMDTDMFSSHLEDDSNEHSKTECKALVVLSGSPKDG